MVEARCIIMLLLCLALCGCCSGGGSGNFTTSNPAISSNVTTHTLTGDIPAGAIDFINQVYGQIQGILTKGPDCLVIRFEGHTSYYSGGVITVAVDAPNWRGTLVHEIAHCIDQARHNDQQAPWLAEVIACHTQAQMGYPQGVSVTYDPAGLTGELLSDYTVYVLFGRWLERQSPGAVKRIVESDLAGSQAVESVLGEPWKIIFEKFINAKP